MAKIRQLQHEKRKSIPNPGESLVKRKLQNDLSAGREKRKAPEDEIERLKFELRHVTQLLFILLAFFSG